MAGKLHEAVHAFEAVVLKEKEHSEAWRMLGMCHAENDEDKKAILCLERAVEEDPYNLDALRPPLRTNRTRRVPNPVLT